MRNQTHVFWQWMAIVSFVATGWGCAGDGGPGGPTFGETTAELTTDEQVSAYQQGNFRYGSTRDGYGCGGVDIAYTVADCPPEYIFYARRGNCGAFTSFAVHCLRGAGYEAYPLQIFSRWPDTFAPGAFPRNYHWVALFRNHGEWYTMDNGRGSGIFRGIEGPYATLNDIPQTILAIEGNPAWP